MPDAHLGLGATVGSVIPTLRAVILAAVGVDIGCGMIAVKTQLTRDLLPDDRKEVREQIERAVPTSAGARTRKIVATAEPRIRKLTKLAETHDFDPARYVGNWALQLANLVALHWSPYGARREFLRSAARKAVTAADLRVAREGIEYRDTAAFIDEIPAAHKPIDQELADAASLVRVRHRLEQLVNVKGD